MPGTQSYAPSPRRSWFAVLADIRCRGSRRRSRCCRQRRRLADAPGAEEVVARLADALLTQALRGALNELQSSDGAGLLAYRDRQIAAAIRLIHGQPERGWTVGELAREVALSRSTFSARFRQLVGESPLRYLTRTRLAHAATLLRTTDCSLAEIAARAGYATEFSFGKAFKRTFGIAPGAYRGESTERPHMRLVAASDAMG